MPTPCRRFAVLFTGREGPIIVSIASISLSESPYFVLYLPGLCRYQVALWRRRPFVPHFLHVHNKLVGALASSEEGSIRRSRLDCALSLSGDLGKQGLRKIHINSHTLLLRRRYMLSSPSKLCRTSSNQRMLIKIIRIGSIRLAWSRSQARETHVPHPSSPVLNHAVPARQRSFVLAAARTNSHWGSGPVGRGPNIQTPLKTPLDTFP